MPRKFRGFTLIELLVVVAIIAVLIAILLPSLGRAREQSKTVKCAANLRSIYQAVTIYETAFDGYMMPERAGVEHISTDESRWFGGYELGAIFTGTGGISNDTDSRRGAIAARVRQILDCPAMTHPAGERWTADYTYNQCMGDHRFYGGNGDPPNPNAFPFLHKAALRPTILIAMDCAELTNSNTDHFSSVPNLVPFDGGNHGSSPDHRGGRYHNQDHVANMLMVDGRIITDNPDKMGDSSNNWLCNSRLDPTGPFPFD
jgi:prepilin-type N-terminal cleavage/methylation domain-containing protein